MMIRRHRAARGTIAAAIILIGGQASEGRATLSYDFSLGAGVRMNDNLHLDPQPSGEEGQRQPVQETIFTIAPGVTTAWSEGRDSLQLTYNGEYSTFQGDEELDPLWVQNIAADLRWRRWSPFFLEVQEERSRVPKPQPQQTNVDAYVDQIDRNLVTVRSGVAREFGPRGGAELAYRGQLETFSGVDDADRVLRQYGEGLVRYRWSPLWGSVLRVAYGKVDRKLIPDYTELSVAAAVEQRLSEHLVAQYRLELLRDAGDQPAADGAAPAEPDGTVHTYLLKGAEITGDLERGGSWSLGYADGLQYLSDGDTLKTGRASAAVAVKARLGSALEIGGWHQTGDYEVSGSEEVAWAPTLGVRLMITPQAALDLGGSWTKTIIRQEGLADIEDHTTLAAAGFVLLLYKRLQFDVGYVYRENDSTGPQRSSKNNIVFAMLTFHFRPVESGRLASSYAAGLVAGGNPYGGRVQVAEGGGTAVYGR